MSYSISIQMITAIFLAVMFSLFGIFTASAVELFYATSAVGRGLHDFHKTFEPWEKKTGNKVTLVPMPASSSDQFAQYRLWLSTGASEIDLYQTDVVWAGQLANYFVDLKKPAQHLIKEHFPQVIESQIVNGKLVALPVFGDAPALYYRKDLLKKYKRAVPKTWQEMTETAKIIQNGERAAGNPNMWGYIWQGNSYEGLTCNTLEWIYSFNGGRILDKNGRITVNNKQSNEALQMVSSWIGTISPQGVLAYMEEETRGIWELGNAVFMRNWSYVYPLSEEEGSAVKGKFDVAPMPSGGPGMPAAATLGGWNVAVSKFSTKQKEAIDLALYLASYEGQKNIVMNGGNLPTIPSLYDNSEIAIKIPMVPRWKNVFLSTVARPSVQTKNKYNEVSSKIWSSVHDALSGHKSIMENLDILETNLIDLKGSGW
ncbi:MAG: trehalose/maltose transport system substrate-binding protein [Candidatus Tokpelaia sp. JSC161]|jgi:trehalose/maltose transport system substrate-binding protein|nr:MAG: trehalose/maltose transport system substrate-binding protein [Candidatus Tokpelaia sp. JSC161]